MRIVMIVDHPEMHCCWSRADGDDVALLANPLSAGAGLNGS